MVSIENFKLSFYISFIFAFEGECNETKDCQVKYSLSIQNEDTNEQNGFVQIDVTRTGEHTHLESKKGQIRGNYSIFTF